MFFFKKKKEGLPGGPVVKSLPCNAGDTGSILDLRRSHMLQSNQASVPQLLTLRAETREAAGMRSPHTATRAQPPTLQPEKARMQQQRPSATEDN